MLTSDLLLTRSEGPYLYPRYIKVEAARFVSMAEELIAIYASYQGKTRRELTDELNRYAEDSTDYRIQRGLAKLLGDDRCEFTERSVAPPAEVRQRLFALARENHPVVLHPDLIHPVTKDELLLEVAREYKTEPEQIAWALYADLTENQILTRFDPPTPEWLLQRYNVALAQAVLLKAVAVQVEIRQEAPARYRQLLRLAKFHRLVWEAEALDAGGFRLRLDGPLSLFSATSKYGLQLALFLPALLHCRDFEIRADLRWGPQRQPRTFRIDPQDGLVSHAPDTGMYVPAELVMFADLFRKKVPDWEITEETALLTLGKSFWVPDYRLRHRSSGREVYLDVLGYWRRSSFERHLELLRQHARNPFVLAISEQLKVDDAEWEGLPAGIHRFRHMPLPEEIARLADLTAGQTTS
ncbi:MAG: DUF790 family protein [Deltaproteobacteria bacterium]|nr:DUF790 family protein [Deltaproteobacteria bacterium]